MQDPYYVCRVCAHYHAAPERPERCENCRAGGSWGFEYATLEEAEEASEGQLRGAGRARDVSRTILANREQQRRANA